MIEKVEIENILQEIIRLFPEFCYKEISVKSKNDISSEELSLIIKAFGNFGFDTKNLNFFVYVTRYGERGSSVYPIDTDLYDEPFKIREGLTHEFTERLFVRDREIAEKIEKFPLLGKFLYTLLRLKIDIKTEREVERRLGEKRMESVYDRISRNPLKYFKEIILLSQLYDAKRRKVYETKFK
jgi:hypothetical protein